jgi:hypothetical protein
MAGLQRIQDLCLIIPALNFSGRPKEFAFRLQPIVNVCPSTPPRTRYISYARRSIFSCDGSGELGSLPYLHLEG